MKHPLCEASTGYCLGFDFYTDKTNDSHTGYVEALDIDNELTTTSQCVLGLMSRCGVLNYGHMVFVDNYYTSPELFNELGLLHTYACGTLRVNRIGAPLAV
mgnify:CR=1 FL=1